jgi:hypothetical protein
MLGLKYCQKGFFLCTKLWCTVSTRSCAPVSHKNLFCFEAKRGETRSVSLRLRILKCKKDQFFTSFRFVSLQFLRFVSLPQLSVCFKSVSEWKVLIDNFLMFFPPFILQCCRALSRQPSVAAPDPVVFYPLDLGSGSRYGMILSPVPRSRILDPAHFLARLSFIFFRIFFSNAQSPSL